MEPLIARKIFRWVIESFSTAPKPPATLASPGFEIQGFKMSASLSGRLSTFQLELRRRSRFNFNEEESPYEVRVDLVSAERGTAALPCRRYHFLRA